jgi:hypothetical protein
MLTKNGWIFFRLLLNKHIPANQEARIALLSEEEQKEISLYPFTSKNPALLLYPELAWLEHIHYSWLEESIKSFPGALLPALVLALPHELQKGLAKLKIATIAEESAPFSPSVKNFILGHFYATWKDKDILPCKLLPESPLSPLLNCTKSELVKIVDMLAMHDLSEEVRHIVDKKILQAIIQTLTADQRKYLRSCLHQKSKIATLPLNAKEVYKDHKAFLTLLHRRGLKRFSLALFGSHPDFIWHIVHTFDTGRGKILLNSIPKEDVKQAAPVIQLEILQIIQLLKTKEAS